MITGLGAITPIGLNVDDFWKNVTAGVSGAGPITLFDASDLPTRIATEVKGFDPKEYMDQKDARRSHRSTHFALAATRQALNDAKLTIDSSNAENVGVVINTGGGGMSYLEEGVQALVSGGPRKIGPFFLPMVMPNAVACQVSIAIGAKGPLLTSTLACASGNYALIEAMRMLQRGEADVIVAGGSESGIVKLFIAAFGNIGALSKRNDDPARASRPFDRDRDGFVYGEGAAVMILETEAHARARDARIYAEVAGGALTSDAYHITAPDTNGDGARRAMARALQSAHAKPEDVDVVFAHGTSTPLNDTTETKAIKAVFGEHAYRLAVSGIKSMVGHQIGAAGAVSALAATLAIRDGVVPPTINLENPDTECDLDYVPNVARQRKVSAAMVNAFGFGGQNVALLLRSYHANGK
ncbi:MAG: beta-ketoacyl-ACP synthase II [Chloroflexi bacterium]|nr:beta-ketoacyl-ACP synthase II [Chloroflexota bacterium]